MRFIKVIFIFFLFFVFGCGQSDKEAYEKAKLKDTVEGYQEFLQKYPKSEFRESAKNQINGIKDKEARVAYKYAKLKDTVDGYEEFIKKYPGNELSEAAKNQIEKIKAKEVQEATLSAPCNGIELVSWNYHNRDDYYILYRALIKNLSNRNKWIYLKYKLRGDDKWYPVMRMTKLERTIRSIARLSESKVKVDSGDINEIEIEIKISDIEKRKTAVEKIALERCR